jgi:GTP-binding protein
MVVANKIDNSSIESNIHEFYELGIDEIIPISAEHRKGINTLTDCMLQKARDLGWTQDEEMEEDEVIRTALVGRPNVGKSSLLNRLAGEERMIVTDIPGTTRDAVDTLIERPDKRDIILIDTAGVRKKARIYERIEKFSIGRALEAIKTCDLTLAVLDVSEGITVQDQHLIGYAQENGKGIITLYNKWDLVQNDTSISKLRMEELKRAKRFVPFSPHLNISALTGKNVKKIFLLIDEVFKDFSSKISTGRANNILGKTMELRSPPIVKGRPLKLFYTTQVSSRPPTFVVFVNHPRLLPGYYKRFLSNQFRAQTGFKLTPIKIIFRKR